MGAHGAATHPGFACNTHVVRDMGTTCYWVQSVSEMFPLKEMHCQVTK